MALTSMMCAIALGGTLATAAIPQKTITRAGLDSQNWLTGPLPLKETIYRPECWPDDEASRHCIGGDRIRQ